jgi:hypothetical protein
MKPKFSFPRSILLPPSLKFEGRGFVPLQIVLVGLFCPQVFVLRLVVLACSGFGLLFCRTSGHWDKLAAKKHTNRHANKCKHL